MHDVKTVRGMGQGNLNHSPVLCKSEDIHKKKDGRGECN